LLFADLSPQGASGTCTQCGTSRLASGSAAQRVTCSCADRTACGTTYDGSGLSLPLGGDGRPCAATQCATQCATDHSAGVSANLLPKGGSGTTAKRAAECGLAGAITGNRVR
jgi:hypothetical protein